jgi:hypothetical protein
VKLYKKKAPKQRERKRNLGQAPKSRQPYSPKEAGHKEIREPPSTGNLHQLLEAYELEKGKVNLTKCRRMLPCQFLHIIAVDHHKFRKYSTNPIVGSQQVVLGHGLLVENLFLDF